MTRLVGFFFRIALVWLLISGPAFAQQPDEEALDYAAWEQVAEDVEQAVVDGGLSTAEFERLRAEVVDWRAQFLDAEGINSGQIERLQSQLDALGPVPEDGTSEDSGVAARRAQLTEELSTAQAPQLAAIEAFNHADGLIQEIDDLIRARSTQAIFETSPMPINPVNWARAITSMTAVFTEVRREIRVRTIFDMRQQEIRERLPVAILLTGLGLLLLVRGRAWTLRATADVAQRINWRGHETLAFLVSFSQLLLPFLGLFLLVAAVNSLEILGPYGVMLLNGDVRVVAIIFVALWLAGRLVPHSGTAIGPVLLAEGRERSARRLIVWVGAVVGLTGYVQDFANLPDVAPAARGVYLLPLYVILGVQFFGLARILSETRSLQTEADEATGFRLRLLGLIIPGLRVVAIVGPVLAALGYLNAAEALMVPAALTLGLLAILLVLRVPIRDSYAAIVRTDPDEAGQALVPVLVNFALVLAALPVLALIWGVRPTELSEVFNRLNEGFALGEARVTPGTVLSILIVFAVGFLATRLLQGALRSTILPRTSLDTGARNALTSGVGYLGIAIAVLLAINAGGIDLTALAFVISALSVGIGFGLQNVVSNFVSGIILLIERPISEGDWIEVNGQMGIVKAISVRSTRIETFDKTDVIVPNADFISGTVTNWTRGNNIGRAVLTVGVAYGTDTRRVADILLEIAKGHPGVASYPEPGVDFLGFGADSLDFRVRAILRDVNEIVAVKTELNHQIAERFAAESIEIPFAQRDIWLRNPETLRGAQRLPAEGNDPDPETDT